jgi:hypothetical protein
MKELITADKPRTLHETMKGLRDANQKTRCNVTDHYGTGGRNQMEKVTGGKRGGNEKGGREMQIEQQEARTFMIQEICEHSYELCNSSYH